MTMKFELDPEF